MGQVTIYLDDHTEKLMQAAAESAGVSKSKWVAEVIREKASKDWPVLVKDLAGAWPDLPNIEEIRSGQPKDAKRNRL